MSARKGKTGELLVAAELLTQGFEVYFPAVDTGIDLLAKKERFVKIQVKSSKHYEQGVSWFTLSKRTFFRTIERDLFYVFVLKRGVHLNFVALPSLWMEQNIIEEVKAKKVWHFYFDLANGRAKETRAIKKDVTSFLNNWFFSLTAGG